jgi:hypothetical protein
VIVEFVTCLFSEFEVELFWEELGPVHCRQHVMEFMQG